MKPGHQIHTRDITFCCGGPRCCCACDETTKIEAQQAAVTRYVERALSDEPRTFPLPPVWAAPGYDGPTPPLDDFIEAYNADDNVFWRIDDGHRLNLLDQAIERIEGTADVLRQLLRALVDGHYRYRPAYTDKYDICPACTQIAQGDVPWPCKMDDVMTILTKILRGEEPPL